MAETEPQAPPSSPLVAAVLSGSAPRALRLGAARGVLPIPRGEAVRLLVALVADPDTALRDLASETLGGIPESEILPLLRDPAAAPEILLHFAGATGISAEAQEAILAHPAAPEDALITLLPGLPPPAVDLLLLNLNRLLKAPRLFARMESLTGLTPSQRARLDEIRRHFLNVPARPEPRPRSVPGAGASPASTIAGAPEIPAASEAPPADVDASPGLEGPPEEGDASEIDSAITRIMRMNTAEKIQLAFKGSREDRGILIKDSSKMVQQSVLDSPKLTENEVETIARMRSVAEDVLRSIAGSRDWMKNYAVVLALATNPKTPVPIAMNLISRLNARDLKIIVTDKNVAELIRRQARKVVDARNAGSARR